MMNGTKLTRLSLSALACMLHVSVVHAQQTWFNGGTDDWDTTSLNWDGGSAAWSNVATNDAIFGTAGDTVTVAEPGIQVDQITFSADGYEIAGATPLTIHGTVAITTLGHTAIISAPIIGNNGFTTTGVADQANHVAPTQWSTLILSNPGNSYVGNTVIGSFASDTANAGALRIGTNEVIPDASNVFLTRKARFELGVHSETINNLFLRNQARVVLDNASTGALYVRHIKFLEHAFIDSGTGDGQIVLNGNVRYGVRDSGSNVAAITGQLVLGADRTPEHVFSVSSRFDVNNRMNGPSFDLNATVSDGATASRLIKSDLGDMTLSGVGNSYSGGAGVTGGRLTVAVGSRLGADVAGNDVEVYGGALALGAASNLGAAQSLTVRSRQDSLGVLALRYNGVPTFNTDTAGVLAIDHAAFNAISDLSAVGNGRWFLGSTTSGTFIGASLTPGLDNTYRLGGGGGYSNGGTLTIANGVLTGDSDLVVGSAQRNGHGHVTLLGNNDFTGSTTVINSYAPGSTNPVTLTLAGAAGAIGSSDSITIRNGTLRLDNTAANNDDRIGAVTVTSHNGSVVLTGNAGVATTESFGDLALASGRTVVTVDAGAGGAATLAGSTLTRNAGTAVVFRGDSIGSAPAANVANVKFDMAPALVGNTTLGGTDAGIIPYALADTNLAGNGAAFATYDVNGIRPLNVPTETTNAVATGQNVRLTAAASTSTDTINSLELNGGVTLSGTAAGGEVLTITSGGILSTGGANTLAGSIESLTFGDNAVTGREGVIHTVSELTISSAIVDNGGPTSLTKTGTGKLNLRGVNTFTGKLAIAGGELNYTNHNQLGLPALGNETIELAGRLTYANGGTATLNRPIHLNATSTIDFATTGTWTLTGPITGENQTLFSTQLFSGNVHTAITGQIDLGPEGRVVHTGSGDLLLSNTANQFGELVIASVNITTGAVMIGADNAVPVTATLTVYNGRFDLRGFDQTVANLTDNNFLNLHDVTFVTHYITRPSVITSSLPGPSTFTVNNAGLNTFSGEISGTELSLTKSNTGTLILTETFTGHDDPSLAVRGHHTYGGNTTVLGGELIIQGSIANNSSDKVFIAADADGNFAADAPTLTRATRLGSSYAGFGSTVVGGLGTTADILAGDNTTGSDAQLTMQWRLGDGPGGVLVSEVLNLTGMNNTMDSTQTDVFVLQMSYDEAEIGGTFYENVAISDGRLYLAWLDDNGNWANAVDGNFGNNATLDQQNYLGDFASFQSLYGSVLTSYIGAWGVDAVNNHVWAVLDHNSQFAVLVPEPATAVVLLVGVGSLLRRRRSPAG